MTSSKTRINYNELIPKVRIQVLKRYENEPDKYDKVDMDKVSEDDWAVLRYIKWNRGDVNKSVEQLNASLQWRHKFGVNERSDSDVPEEFVKTGCIFAGGVDISDRPLLYMRAKVYKKLPQLDDIYRQFVVGVINTLDIEAGPNGYTLVFDVSGVGLSNADMEFVQFLINTMNSYFPYGLRQVIVYNLPLLLKPLWAIAKLWIGSNQKFIKFASGNQIMELISVEHLPLYMGGSLEIDFTSPPEGCKSVKELASKYGFTDTEVDKYIKIFEPHMIEAQKLVIGAK